MNANELNEIVRLHGMWLRNEDGGKRANLTDANLTGANLTGANLSGANLEGANLTGANLTLADLTLAKLTGANLTLANLRRANLTLANLRRANLTGANLIRARLTGANLKWAKLEWFNIPKIEKLHNKILDAIKSGGQLEMGTWHTCETTHCRAGWAIHLAGDAGTTLETNFGSSAAGALIFAASYPDQPVPNFYATNEDAMDDIIKCAKEEE